MTQSDSAKLRFYRRCRDYCRASTCGRIIGVLDVDLGSLLPEVEAGDKLIISVEAPIDLWVWPGAVDWFSALDPKWSAMRPAIGATADAVVRPWIERGHSAILGMTWSEILGVLEQHKSIDVPR